MKKFLFLATLTLLSFQTVYAFSPLDQSAIEISDIVNSPHLRRYFPPFESILDIRRVPNGYLISSNRYQLFVEVRYRLKGAQGAADGEKKSYDLKFNEPTQSNSNQ